jgi:hypothetical protein
MGKACARRVGHGLAPDSSFFALGAASTSTIAVIPDYDMVIVSRWVDGEAMDELIGKILRAVKEN